MKKLKLYENVIEKHERLEKSLWFISFILLFPFFITQLLEILFDKITNFGGFLRNKMVYGLLRFILKKELQEFQQKFDKQEEESDDE